MQGAMHSWLWHLFYGMWRGYCEARWYEMGALQCRVSVDGDWNVKKVFWNPSNGRYYFKVKSWPSSEEG